MTLTLPQAALGLLFLSGGVWPALMFRRWCLVHEDIGGAALGTIGALLCAGLVVGFWTGVLG